VAGGRNSFGERIPRGALNKSLDRPPVVPDW
jgi:hypothetical protein